MPIIASAIKKLRQDRKREIRNSSVKSGIKKAVKNAKSKKTKDAISKAIALAYKAAKRGIIHKNKAARIASTVSKLITRPKANIKKV